MDERRRHPRIEVSWPVRVWIEGRPAMGQTVDASAYGLCVRLSAPVPVQAGRSHRVDLFPGTDREFTCMAEVRHISDRGAGMETRQRLPRSLIPPQSADEPEPAR